MFIQSFLHSFTFFSSPLSLFLENYGLKKRKRKKKSNNIENLFLVSLTKSMICSRTCSKRAHLAPYLSQIKMFLHVNPRWRHPTHTACFDAMKLGRVLHAHIPRLPEGQEAWLGHRAHMVLPAMVYNHYFSLLTQLQDKRVKRARITLGRNSVCCKAQSWILGTF